MTQSQQKRWLTDLLEGVPSVVFIVLWRQSGDLETAGWVGAGTALAILSLLVWMRTRMHSVLVGVNAHILLATPLIVGLFRIGQTDLAKVLASHAYPGVLVTVFVAGGIQTLVSGNGFSALERVSQSTQRRYSLGMLVICGLGAVWALVASGNPLVPVVATLTVLIVGRNFLQARLSDRNGAGAAVLSSSVLERSPSDFTA